MAAEENRALIRRFLEELFNQHDVAAIDRYIAADYVDHVVPPGVPPTREGFTQFIRSFLEALPDFHYTIEDMIVDGDRVAVRLTADGTQQGAFNGIPPTGKHATWSEMHIGRIKDGAIVEHWGEIDNMGMLQQLGVIPAPQA
ncbi:MAG TPA: ester cyclase [Roseiflexaceae bacterium]|nr:ester cyclase [Roseiflexaceae bacterium]